METDHQTRPAPLRGIRGRSGNFQLEISRKTWRSRGEFEKLILVDTPLTENTEHQEHSGRQTDSVSE